MTNTPPFYHLTFIALLGASGSIHAGTAQLLPAPASSAAPVPRIEASTSQHVAPSGHLQQQTSKQVTIKAAPRPRSPVGDETVQLDKTRVSDRYHPQQRGLIDQYQNAVTPPVDSGH